MKATEIDEVKQTVLSKVLGFIAYRARTTKEIKDRLGRYLQHYKNLEPSETQTVIDFIMNYLEENKLLDDTEFMKLYVESKSSSKKPIGKRVILEKLQQKGIDRQLAEEFVDRTVSKEDELTAAVNSLEKKFPNIKDHITGTYEDRALTDKLGRYLLSRGFSYGIAREAVDYLLKRP